MDSLLAGEYLHETESHFTEAMRELIIQLRGHAAVRTFMPYVLLAAAFFYASYSAIVSLVNVWLSRDDYSHGFIIPFVSILLAWSKREKLNSIEVKPYLLAGLAVVIVGGIVLWLGTATGLGKINGLSVLLLIPGLILMIFGYGHVKALAFPLLYLIFMVPLFDFVIVFIYRPFQLFSATSAALLLKLVQIPVVQQMQYLELPSLTLEVARTCSGVSYLFAIIAVAIPLAYFTQQTPKRRFTLIMSAGIIGILANGIRIFLIGVWVYLGHGYTGVHGPNHVLQGYFVAACGYVFLFVTAWIMSRNPDQSQEPSRGALSQDGSKRQQDPISRNIATVVATLVLLAFGIGNLYFKPKPIVSVNLADILPLTIGQWQGEDVIGPISLVKPQNIDGELSRKYRDPSGNEVMLYVGYIGVQRDGDNLLSFSIDKKSEEPRTLPVIGPRNEPVNISETIQELNGSRARTLSWFVTGSKVTSNKWKLRLLTLFEGMVRGRTDGAFIVIKNDIWNSSSQQNSADFLADFATRVMPYMEDRLFSTEG